jgi:predicted hydrolase (HD superfamily)
VIILYTHMLQQTTLVHMYIREFGGKRALQHSEQITGLLKDFDFCKCYTVSFEKNVLLLL